ncbi:MAG: prepilin peptidase [Bdellovibrionales bacterium]
MTLEIFAFSCLLSGFGLLLILSVIDLKIGLLPNVYNFAFAVCGGLFHAFLSFSLMGPEYIALGALVGGGLLWGIRFVANRIYEQDTLGLGDVKLLAAAGIWLGPSGVLLAITAGAFAGILHSGLVLGMNKVRSKNSGQLSHFSIPAGPGFAIGIAGVILYQYWQFIHGGWL